MPKNYQLVKIADKLSPYQKKMIYVNTIELKLRFFLLTLISNLTFRILYSCHIQKMITNTYWSRLR